MTARPKRETQQQRDERIVREALHWCGQWSFSPFTGLLCQQWENYNLMEGGRAQRIPPSRTGVFAAAARILNRLSRKAPK